jgi:hypothetical protein
MRIQRAAVVAPFAFITFGLVAQPASAAAPRLFFPCGVPQHSLVTCVLRGQGFVPHERVSITYRVGAGTPSGGYRTVVYRRTDVADAKGSFARPALRFAVDPRVLSYRVTVVVRGAHGDHAEIGSLGTP